MSKVVLPGQQVPVDTPNGVDPVWYEKLSTMAAGFGKGLLPNQAPPPGTATTPYGGFMYMPTMAGAPTGTPFTQAGFVPFVYDTTNNKLWIYSGASWRGVVLA